MAIFTSSEAPLHDPTALARFGRLDIIARLIVEGTMIGQHKSPFKGSSVEFVEHRQYYPGDEIRHIDWRAYGKTGKYYIKEFEEETNLRAYLIVDASGSMAYGASTLTKFEYARILAAALGYLLIGQRDAVGLTTFDTRIRERVEPSSNMLNFQRMRTGLESTQPGAETSLSAVFQQIIPLLKRRSLVIVCSDFFDDLHPFQQVLKQLRHAHHEVMLFQIVAPEEEDFPFSRPTQFRNLERDGHRLLVDPHRLRAVYLEQYQKFLTELTAITGAVGIDYCKIVTSRPFTQALGEFLDARTRRAKGR